MYTSIACNRCPQSADWGKNGQIIFAACNSIALVNVEDNDGRSAKIVRTFVEHTAKVNTVKWLSEHEFLSGAYDGQCILWNIADDSCPKIMKLIGHSAGVTFVDAIQVNGEWLIATTSLDSTIKFWTFSSEINQYVVIDTIDLGTGLCFALKFTILPQTKNKVLLAYATDQHHVDLVCEQIIDGQRTFVKVGSLIGHENWVRGIDITTVAAPNTSNTPELLVATASQDTFIRLWRISPRPTIDPVQRKRASIAANVFVAKDEIQIEEKLFTVKSDDTLVKPMSYAIILDAVLLGHDGWVYGVHWSRSGIDNRLQLLSSSIDKTLIIWSQQDDAGVWMEQVRVGEVGGNTLGFYGGKFSPDAKSIMGHGYQGSFHIWYHESSESNRWLPSKSVVGGHFAEVRDLCWNPNGEYLLTVSADQTTRCHAPWRQKAASEKAERTHVSRNGTGVLSNLYLSDLCFVSDVARNRTTTNPWL